MVPSTTCAAEGSPGKSHAKPRPCPSENVAAIAPSDSAAMMIVGRKNIPDVRL
jgi:hypothetical protein